MVKPINARHHTLDVRTLDTTLGDRYPLAVGGLEDTDVLWGPERVVVVLDLEPSVASRPGNHKCRLCEFQIPSTYIAAVTLMEDAAKCRPL